MASLSSIGAIASAYCSARDGIAFLSLRGAVRAWVLSGCSC
jgi:hypothetical protein